MARHRVSGQWAIQAMPASTFVIAKQYLAGRTAPSTAPEPICLESEINPKQLETRLLG
jgi:hypothetical protein